VLANEACLAELLDMADDGKAAHHACLRHLLQADEALSVRSVSAIATHRNERCADRHTGCTI
jgi:hypothetical protein